MEMFQSLSSRKTPASVLSVSVAVHVGLLSVLILLPLMAPQALHINYRTMLLAPPPEPVPQPEPVKKVVLPPVPIVKPTPRPTDLIAEKLPAPPPKVVAPVPEVRLVEAPKPPEPTLRSVASPLFDPKPTSPAPPTLPVITNSFSRVAAPVTSTTSARNTAAGFGDTSSNQEVNHASKTTSAAGFGDSSGSRDRGRPSRGEGIGTVGGFDVGITGGSRGRGSSGPVMAAGFMAVADAPKATAPARAAEPTTNDKPVEVLSKPRPDYTDEARKLRIEGEVLVRVMFTSSGQARVLEVMKGLGYGLNENAIRAAEQIRFKPAQRSGQSVDSTAIVHIVFQLAY